MHIKTQDKAILVATFVIGAVAGAYLYLMGYVPQFVAHNEVPQQQAMQQFTLEGDSYGGMRRGVAPSFQILADGTYRYIPFTADETTDAATMQNTIKEGTLPTGIMQNLRAALTPTDLTLAARSVTKDSCASMVDGIDYRYTVTVSGAEFKLDTCTTALSSDTPVGQALTTVWEFFASLEVASEQNN